MPELLLPEGFDERRKPEMLKSRQEIPLSVWQGVTNKLFYGGHADPLAVIQTLGNSDPLLPTAYVTDMAMRNEQPNIHEIGPGNFYAAKTIADYMRSKLHRPFSYTCHDAYAKSHDFHRDELPNEVSFSNCDIRNYPAATAGGGPAQTLMIEVLDDTDTEHAAFNAGNEYLMCVVPHLSSGVRMESKALAAKKLSDMGQFSQARVLLADGASLEKTYTAREIVSMIDRLDIAGLQDVHPTFLRDLQYGNTANRADIHEIARKRFEDAEGDYETYLKSVIQKFRDQLRSVTEGNAVGLPLAGIRMLWDMRNETDRRIDIFDYGYTDEDLEGRTNPLSYSVFNGQITSSVNFDVLKHAARELGMTAQLGTVRDYIRKQLGIDSVSVGKLLHNCQHVRKPVHSPDLFRQAIRLFAHDKILTPEGKTRYEPEDVPLSGRIDAEDVAQFVRDLTDHGLLRDAPDLSEGKYHLSIEVDCDQFADR